MTISYVEQTDADSEMLGLYDQAEERFTMLLNIFKVFGHIPEYGKVFMNMVMATLKGGELDWVTEELLIFKATHSNECQYCTIIMYIAISKFGDALGVELAPVFTGNKPILRVAHH